MAENVSSNVLFHLTSSMRHLLSILKHGFFPHYCPEYTLRRADTKAAARNESPEFAIPQVSFCDLPLSLIKNHLDKYGDFGIGLDKEWGLRNGVSSVAYTHNKAETGQAIAHLVEEFPGSQEAILLANYTRPYTGAEWRKGKVKNGIRFYDEREWRYVPLLQKGVPLVLPRAEYDDKRKVAALERKLKAERALKIGPDDIQYLIVPTDRHVIRLAEFLKQLYGGYEGILVTTAIMTADRIREDI